MELKICHYLGQKFNTTSKLSSSSSSSFVGIDLYFLSVHRFKRILCLNCSTGRVQQEFAQIKTRRLQSQRI
jgi:hypothetical protein